MWDDGGITFEKIDSEGNLVEQSEMKVYESLHEFLEKQGLNEENIEMLLARFSKRFKINYPRIIKVPFKVW